MGTPISAVFKKFLSQIDDKEWLLVEDEVIEDLMLDYLENATVDFMQCRKDLSFTPPEKGELKYHMDGLTSEIKINLQSGKIPTIDSIVGSLTGQEYLDPHDYSYNKDGTISFTHPPTEDITVKWEIDGEFTENLDALEIRILAHGMVLNYLKPKILTQESLKQYVSDKDFTKLSGANMLLRLIGLEKSQIKQMDVLQGKYAFKDFKGFN